MNLKKFAIFATLTAAVGSLIARNGVAQDTPLQHDVAFVRALANKMRFISLAQSEVERMKTRYKNDIDSIEQLGIEISIFGAKVNPNRAEKRTLFKDALERLSSLIDGGANPDVILAARITMADASREFGAFLADEIEVTRVEAPDKVKDLEDEAGAVFRSSVDNCDAAMATLKEKEGESASIDYHVTWMRKGILLREHARAVRKDREYLVDRARETLEDLIFEVGEETALGLRALFEYAQCDEVAGNLDQAISSYRDVIDTANTSLTEPNIQLPTSVRELMVVTMEEAYDRIAAGLFEQGKSGEVLATLESYRENLDALGVPLTDLDDPATTTGNEDARFGHSFYLTAARAMAESGNPDDIGKALALVQFINDQHPNDFVGLRASVALKDILASQSHTVSGTLLFKAARGDYRAKNYEAAIQGLRRAIGAMSAAEAATTGLEAYYLLGHSLALQGRVLEATIALKLGLERHGATGDSGTAEKAASLIQRTMRQLRLNSKNDEFFDALDRDVGVLAGKFGSVADAAKRSWDEALRLLEAKEYDKAIAKFRNIEQGSLYYEWAQSRIAMAQQRSGDLDGALESVHAYHAYLETKDAIIPNDRNDLKQVRRLAEAEIAFIEGYVTYLQGMGNGKNRDLTKFPEVVKLLSDFESQHGRDAGNLVPVVQFLLGRSYVEMGNLAKAEEKYRAMQAGTPQHRNIPVLATAIFTAYDEQLTAKRAELDSIINGDDKEAVRRIRSELNELRRKTLAIGIDYFEHSDDPQYGIAYLTLEQARNLGDWERVESFGNRIVQQFENDPEANQRVDKFVRPIIGNSMLHQHKYRQAYDMLVAAEKARPNNFELKRLICLALGGWQEFDENAVLRKFKGLEKPAEAYQKYWDEYKAYALNPQRTESYSIEWYRFYWELYHFAHAAAANDSEYQRIARQAYETARSFDKFEHLSELGVEGRELMDLFLENPPN